MFARAARQGQVFRGGRAGFWFQAAGDARLSGLWTELGTNWIGWSQERKDSLKLSLKDSLFEGGFAPERSVRNPFLFLPATLHRFFAFLPPLKGEVSGWRSLLAV